METAIQTNAYILPDHFWEALLEIHGQLFFPLCCEYLGLPPEKQDSHVFRAFQVLDCYLDATVIGHAGVVPVRTQ
ncbi:MAG TPA: hypothetical protein VGN12_20620 [Pirellulales bacterium]|jgi:hypothetical protein